MQNELQQMNEFLRSQLEIVRQMNAIIYDGVCTCDGVRIINDELAYREEHGTTGKLKIDQHKLETSLKAECAKLKLTVSQYISRFTLLEQGIETCEVANSVLT